MRRVLAASRPPSPLLSFLSTTTLITFPLSSLYHLGGVPSAQACDTVEADTVTHRMRPEHRAGAVNMELRRRRRRRQVYSKLTCSELRGGLPARPRYPGVGDGRGGGMKQSERRRRREEERGGPGGGGGGGGPGRGGEKIIQSGRSERGGPRARPSDRARRKCY